MNMIIDRTPPCRIVDYMSTTIHSVDIDATLIIGVEQTEPMSVAIELMKDHGLAHLAVTEANNVIGILSLFGVVRYYSELLPVVHDLARLTPDGPAQRANEGR